MKLPVEQPGQVKCRVLDSVPCEERSACAVMRELTTLTCALQTRWDLYCSHQNWLEGSRWGKEPTFWDEERGCERSGKHALAPCPLVNKVLNNVVGITLRVFSPQLLGDIMRMIEEDPVLTETVSVLRLVAIHAEEAMEQEALGIFFSIVKDKPEKWLAKTKDLVVSQTIKSYKVELFRSLVVHMPLHFQNQHPDSYPGLVFKYFQNYADIVTAELQLLKVPAVLQNSKATYHYSSREELFDSNPVLNKLQKLAPKSQFATKFVACFPELFGYQNLKDLTFTFVGAGFPLTGIILHIETGANINLVDYDSKAIRSATEFIALAEEAGIVRPGAMRLFHADATEVVYLPGSKLLPGMTRYDGASCPPFCPMSPTMSGKIVVPTDILDLASALSAETTAKVIRVNASLVPIIRKRNVRGISEILYEHFSLSDHSGHTFRLAGEVTPPQKVASGATPAHLVTGLTSTVNVNSCQLYSNTCNFASKWAYLETLQGREEYTELGLEKPLWDSKVLEFYGKRNMDMMTECHHLEGNLYRI